MKGKVIVTKINIRSEMSTRENTDVGDLLKGDVVYGTPLGIWIAFTRVYRVGGKVDELGFTRYAAISNPLNASETYITLTNEAEPPVTPPTPTPSSKPFEIVIRGNDYQATVKQNDGQTVIVEMSPKA